MGTNVLRQLLREFCHNLLWNYAVFWKLEHQNRMFLAWEDGCCDYPKPRELVESLLDDCCFNVNNLVSSFGCEESTCNGVSGHPSKLAVASMSCLRYAFGKGVVGEVASTEKHCWVFADKVYVGEFNSELAHECPDEWLLQFAAGIKTILLVPVIPHGVVQLGSLETISEDPTLVAYIKDIFNNLQYVAGDSSSLTSSKELTTPSLSSLSSFLLDNLVETSAITHNQLYPSQMEDLMTLNCVEIAKDKFSILPPQLDPPLLMLQDDLQGPGEDLQPIQESVHKVAIDALSVGPTGVSCLPESMNANHFEMMGDNPFSFSHLTEDIYSFSHHNDTKKGAFARHSHLNMNIYSDRDFMDIYEDETAYITYDNIFNEFLSFPMDSELLEALGPAFQKNCDGDLWDPAVTGEDVCSSSSLIYHRDLSDGIKPSVGESHDWFKKKPDAEYLLDAVVANVHTASFNAATNKSSIARSPSTLSGEFAVSCQTQTKSEAEASSLKRTPGTLIDYGLQKKKYVGMQPCRGAKLSRVSKRRTSPDDVQRRRPRDRQMIQDRVKKLRELVPNGAKCSIDALLDRTAKHMLFLRSISNRAEKLRHCIRSKVISKNSKVSHSYQNDVSWAFELGSQIGVCPIVVEDLDHSGHMLIEMLCEEDGLFLEIAQVIRHLELTILKGVTENRSNKMWAHFIVEASTSFQRMDIFWPLMQLLQRKGNSITRNI